MRARGVTLTWHWAGNVSANPIVPNIANCGHLFCPTGHGGPDINGSLSSRNASKIRPLHR